MKNNYEFTPIEFREKILQDLEIRISDSIILVCAILIASIGLNMNSNAVVIGAMLISPVMTPILALGYGLSVLDSFVVRKSAKLLLLEVAVSIIVSSLYFMISPISYPSSEIISRTSPTIWDVIIAFAGGVAGIIGARKKQANNIVPGVAVATALMPPLCTIGYSISVLKWDYFLGSSYLFVINSAFIIVATVIGIRVMKFPVHYKVSINKNRINLFLLVISILIMIPSIISASSLVQDSVRKYTINNFLKNEFKDYVILDQNYKNSQNKLVLTVSGKKINASKMNNLKESLSSYGLKKVTLEVIQIPELGNLKGEELSKYLDQYIQNKLDENTDKNIESKKEKNDSSKQINE
ncbi:DUF389 domain-containing protein [Lactococcus lactis]|uniref:DUF389 domain-containing protein n=1 Tax=Lactococcus lactis TaxID=1358 RepID=UPI0025A286AC|nr:DUF389 domain-containing protein [Lactococcus lactis]MDM7645266.1 DUF389 domain-containing protein [Lactococcus lactis]